MQRKTGAGGNARFWLSSPRPLDYFTRVTTTLLPSGRYRLVIGVERAGCVRELARDGERAG